MSEVHNPTIWDAVESGDRIGFTIRPWRFARNKVLRNFCETAERDGLSVRVHQHGGWLRSRCEIRVGGFRIEDQFRAFLKAWYRWMNDNERMLMP